MCGAAPGQYSKTQRLLHRDVRNGKMACGHDLNGHFYPVEGAPAPSRLRRGRVLVSAMSPAQKTVMAAGK